MYKRIFVCNRAGLGDVILANPVLKALKHKFPDSKITLMVGWDAVDIVEDLDFIDEVITYAYEKQRGIPDLIHMVRKVWRYDLAILLDFKYRSAFMAFLAGIPIRAGIEHKRKLFLTHPMLKPPDWESTYEPHNYAKIIKYSLGIELDAAMLDQLCLPAAKPHDINAVDQLLTAQGTIKDTPLITIAPFTSWTPKDWPIGYYRQLTERLSLRYPHKIILIGLGSDCDKLDGLDQNPRVINLMGKTTLAQTIEVIRRSGLFIGGCSAPLHIAGACNTPYVVPYGPTSPSRWAPRSPGIVITRNPACGPCNVNMTGCAEKPCMMDITVEEMYEACVKMLVTAHD